MIELHRDQLMFHFPEVHPNAHLVISFQRTLRVPDDGRTYPLPPGLGNFPVRHVDDFSHQVPPQWSEHGGVMLPMYQSEAMWLLFNSSMVSKRNTPYPFAITVLTGKINAVNGEEYRRGLYKTPQSYVVTPGQPWLDGYCAGKGLVRQFVAMPLGDGYTAEEQITGAAEYGGLQLVVHPMKRESFERHFPERDFDGAQSMRLRCKMAYATDLEQMGLAAGGKIKQQIYQDRFQVEDWHDEMSRCFVHIANSKAWRQITGSAPPVKPPTAKQYARAGLPWFDYYDDSLAAIDGAEPLDRLLSVATLKRIWHGKKLDGNKSCMPETIISLRNGLKKDQVRETDF